MSDLKLISERIIEDAINKGDFANLSGQGRALKIEDDPYTPPHLRLAHKLMRDNEIAPEWIMDGSDLEDLRSRILAALGRAAVSYRRKTGATPEIAWTRAVRRFEQQAGEYNRKLLSYNLKVPPGVNQRPYLDTAREVRRALEAAEQ